MTVSNLPEVEYPTIRVQAASQDYLAHKSRFY
jgi:hypothetical protein